MVSIHRRRFLRDAAAIGAGWAAHSWSVRLLHGKPPSGHSALLIVDSSRRVAPLERRLLGAFIEHLGRAIYGGIFDPNSKLSDPNGFRKDVTEEVRRLGVPIIRYPGGNFVSGYNWLHGVGPKQDRPRVLDRAWNTLDSNQFGTNEFIAWCRMVGAEPLLAANLGPGTPETAAALVEYCNLERGTTWSDLRRRQGIEAPHRVKVWCLGNEMDGPWQIGHMPADEYGRKAADAARQMRVVDPSVQLIACGSSGPFMPTYLEWDRQVLEGCYNEVDGISLHRYFSNTQETGGDTRKFLALNLTMDRQIEDVIAVCDFVRTRKRSNKKLWLSFDEWNVWYRERNGDGRRQEGPRLLEEVYNLEDALLVGGILNTLLRHADRVAIACLAQLVNVIAPLVTNENGVLKQTIYHPYAWALQYARGHVLDLFLESPAYEVEGLGSVPYFDVAGTVDTANGRVSLFILNRDLEKSRELDVVWHEGAPSRVLVSQVLTGPDLKAFNSFDKPNHVVPQPLEPPRPGSRTTFNLPPRSYAVVQVALA